MVKQLRGLQQKKFSRRVTHLDIKPGESPLVASRAALNIFIEKQSITSVNIWHNLYTGVLASPSP